MKKIFMAFVMFSSSLTFAAVSENILTRHREIVGPDACQSELESEATSFDLDSTRSVVLVPCVMGAYQGSSVGYIVYKLGGGSVSLSPILALESSSDGISATTDLMQGDYNPKTGILSTFGKARGLGDCGESSKIKIGLNQYGSVDVKTIEIRRKDKCDGKYNTWPVVFKQ